MQRGGNLSDHGGGPGRGRKAEGRVAARSGVSQGGTEQAGGKGAAEYRVGSNSPRGIRKAHPDPDCRCGKLEKTGSAPSTQTAGSHRLFDGPDAQCGLLAPPRHAKRLIRSSGSTRRSEGWKSRTDFRGGWHTGLPRICDGCLHSGWAGAIEPLSVGIDRAIILPVGSSLQCLVS